MIESLKETHADFRCALRKREIENAANAHTRRITVTLPVRKEVDSDD